ncbi:hypothetical protein AB3S75_012206 [Citrus x aurantiifolia]
MLFSTSVFFILSFAFTIFSYWIDAFLLVATKIDDPGLVPVLHCHLLVAQGDAVEAGPGAYLDPFHLR